MKLSIWILFWIFRLRGSIVVRYAASKSLHSLKQSPRAWFSCFSEVVLSLGCVRYHSDHFIAVLMGGVSFLYMWMILLLLLLGMMHRVLLKLSKPLAEPSM